MACDGDPSSPIHEYEPASAIVPEDYESFIGSDGVEELKRLSEPLQGHSWTNINSTFVGGGVAEMLRSVIPLARSLGIDARWCVIQGGDEFFQVTKKLHNLLQGVDQPISLEEIFHAYLDTIDDNAQNMLVASDLVVVHDPQPAAMIMNGNIFGRILWRCHIDTSAPNHVAWRFLLPYINHCAGAIFTMPEFVGPGLQVPIYQITPCIDPLAEKNRRYSSEHAREILQPLFRQHRIDAERPIIAAVSRYDIHKNQATIIEAFKALRRTKRYDPRPYMIFLGNTATDDPEGGAVLAELKRQAGEDEDIHFWVNVENNDQVVGALMSIARAMVHVSTREGFGLVVSEALWQGTPVIGSRTGGITRQVIDEQTGFLVEALDSQTLARRMAWILDHPVEAGALGEQGREHVRRHFLLPELVRHYLVLLRFYLGEQEEIPDFRLDNLSYAEFLHALGRRHPSLPE
jgi:trehalose synthase